jgi:hemerythrin-like domain-containing protein
MRITEAIAAEHVTLSRMFDNIERKLPSLKSRAQIRATAAVVAGLLGRHAESETDLAFQPLDRAQQGKGRFSTVEQEHHEIDARLHQARAALTCAQARRLLRAAMGFSRRHFRNEERCIFPLLERALKPEDSTALGKAFCRAR